MKSKADIDIATEVLLEREQQDFKWGEQNWPQGSPLPSFVEAEYKRLCEEAAKAGTLSWRDILLEEVYEFACETDVVKRRAELIQVAAVAIAAIGSIDRNELGL